ncbi:unnamed protein product [Taenia asiatica]|uniref:Uncharacterized protein n=1 Tax=Taenia asiatica TaxID=60517 RepID=A0A0R3W2D8_TAEAS|nr:unnamed protein product [Taenia asiatica]
MRTTSPGKATDSRNARSGAFSRSTQPRLMSTTCASTATTGIHTTGACLLPVPGSVVAVGFIRLQQLLACVDPLPQALLHSCLSPSPTLVKWSSNGGGGGGAL